MPRSKHVGDLPFWLRQPLPITATENETVMAEVEKQLAQLPGTLWNLSRTIAARTAFRDYDTLVQRANAVVWQYRVELWTSDNEAVRGSLIEYAASHFPPEGKLAVMRRLAKDPSRSIRRKVEDFLKKNDLHEVSLPQRRGGDWNPNGWRHGTPGAEERPRHLSGERIQRSSKVPLIRTVGGLRELLGISSPKQLGYLLLATDANGGPYRKFTVPKRTGGQRVICAPGKSLRIIQRRILDRILSTVVPHPAANGFVKQRSTITNALPHVGAKLILKFDLENFFPTIHGYRVLGMFARLGYAIDDGRFGTDDDSLQVAPVLARLCCYASDPKQKGIGTVPQGAPTSPAVSNLVCRGLDARLTGLADRMQGVYTRYADDLTFSFRDDGLNVGRFRWWVNQICHQEGFYVNEAKFRVLRSSQRQMVTGLVVNEQLHVTRELRRKLRNILHNCKMHGVASQARGRENFLDWLRGQASYVHMVQPAEGQKMLDAIAELERGAP